MYELLLTAENGVRGGGGGVNVKIRAWHTGGAKKKWMNRITSTWRNGCFERIYDHPDNTIPNHHPILKRMFSQKHIRATSSEHHHMEERERMPVHE